MARTGVGSKVIASRASIKDNIQILVNRIPGNPNNILVTFLFAYWHF